MKLADLLSLQAPAGVVSPAPALDSSGLDQSDIIGHRELVELAQRLVKRKDEKHQQLGRALAAVTRGAAFAASGFRNETMRLLALEILEAYPYANHDGIVDVFRMSLELMASEARAGNPAPTEAELRSMLSRFQGAKQAKAQTTQWLVDAATRGQSPMPQTGALALPPAVDAFAGTAPPPPDAAPEPDGFDHRNIIVIADSEYYVRHPQGRVYPFHLATKEALRIELQRSFAELLPLRDEMGEMLPIDRLVDTYASNAHEIVYDYNATAVEFDPFHAKIRIGFRMGEIDRYPIPPVPSLDVEAWLEELAGGAASVGELYDWIAATDQRWIGTNATALVIVGGPGIGKSQLARALAYTWGARTPAKFGYVMDRFNGALRTCPIWHADEQMPENISDTLFRELVQERQRDIELKGRERVPLVGCARIVITLNEITDLRISTPHGTDAMRAVADRISIFRALPGATNALMMLPKGDAEVETIAKHIRWIQTENEPRAQRFLGGRGNVELALEPILKATAARAPAFFEGIAEYLQNFAAWEREYHSGPPSPMRPGARFPIIAEDGLLWINKGELCKRLMIADHSRHWTEAVIKPFVCGEAKRFCIGEMSPWLIPLDPEKLETVIGVDPVPALVGGTRARLGILRK